MSQLRFSANEWDKVKSFLENPNNDNWDPWLSIDSITITNDLGNKVGIPIQHYQELKEILEKRLERTAPKRGCILF
jgi:hypothetical protein